MNHFHSGKGEAEYQGGLNGGHPFARDLPQEGKMDALFVVKERIGNVLEKRGKGG